ncbi:hypothetical protein [Dyella tabacisoli]|uniref:Uncharacterized protein n=1 Tax=Dyella tabacisoli TaxID=2282381 RepID=A0A369UNH4_9GAMM|nr:hypothetical protein [Dyella tabacisoli]RDD81268.1 hypothetical protein DVJ77_13215 [Dyella tabacisoli]
MTRHIVTYCLLVFVLLLSLNSLAQDIKNQGRGQACYAKSVGNTATCGPGLTCKDGYCELESYLSGATVSCKSEMAKAGWTSYVAVHDGFCYVNSQCGAMYNAAMAASGVTEKLLMAGSVGSEAYMLELAKLSDQEKATFKRAEDQCKSCGKYCTIGSSFLGRGGY